MREQEEEDTSAPIRPLPPVDISQLRERLALTPAERLRLAVESANNLRRFLENVRLLK
jgi:hypothetical protein